MEATDDWLALFARAAGQSVGASTAMVFLAHEHGDELELAHVSGASPDDAPAAAPALCQALCQAVRRSREATVRDGAVAIPLVSREDCLGVVVLVHEPRRLVRVPDRAVLDVLGTLGAALLACARGQRELQRALAAREELLATVCHDLRHPLSLISVTAAELRRSTPAAGKAAETIARAVGRMKRLARDLLDAAQIEAGGLAVSREASELGEILRLAVEDARIVAHPREVVLASDPRGIEVPCDRERVLRILDNLLGNAIKFTPPDGRITVEVEERAHDVVVAISDTGPGIPPDQLARIFDRFYQGPPGAATPAGAGLGLYITKNLVEAHGGVLLVTSVVGRGTRISFSLPTRDPR